MSTFQTVEPLAGSRYPVSWMSQTTLSCPLHAPLPLCDGVAGVLPITCAPLLLVLIVCKGDLLQNSHLVQLDTVPPVCEDGVIRGGLLAAMLHVDTVQISLVLVDSSDSCHVIAYKVLA